MSRIIHCRISMDVNDQPPQRRPPAQTYARVPKRQKLHHSNQRSHTDDPTTHTTVIRRGASSLSVVNSDSGTEVGGAEGKKGEGNGSEEVLQDTIVPVLSAIAATVRGEVGKSGSSVSPKGRTTSAPMLGLGVKRGTIEAYFMRMPVKKEGVNTGGTTLDRDTSTLPSTKPTGAPPASAAATAETTMQTPSATEAARIIAAGTTANQTFRSSPMAIFSILNSPPHELSHAPNLSSATSVSPPASPTLLSTATPRRRKRHPNSTQPPTKKLTQLHLDLGQTPSRTTCPTCHMSYDLSLSEDNLLHKRFHSKSTGGVDFVSTHLHILWAGIRFVQDAWEGKEREQIIVVNRDCHKLERKRVMEVMEVVEKELGCQEIKEEEIFGALKYNAKGRRERDRYGEEGQRYKVFLYLLGRKCIGMLLAERIEKAYKIILHPSPSPASTSISPTTSSTTSSAPINPDDDDLCPSSPPPADHPLTLTHTPSSALLGVSRIWTCSTYRRRGVAMRLLDVARHAFIYGMVIDKSQVAFSQPTAIGKALAGEWFSREMDAVESVDEGEVEFGLDSVGQTRDLKGEGTRGDKGGWMVYLDEDHVPG